MFKLSSIMMNLWFLLSFIQIIAFSMHKYYKTMLMICSYNFNFFLRGILLRITRNVLFLFNIGTYEYFSMFCKIFDNKNSKLLFPQSHTSFYAFLMAQFLLKYCTICYQKSCARSFLALTVSIQLELVIVNSNFS